MQFENIATIENIPPIENINFSEAAYINPLNLLFNLFLTAFLSYILGLIFIRFGKSISNKASLASSFPMLSITTMIIITVVKSSLALSLGLVGALSIVRFRTPIKEPEELTYLFLAIVLGLTIGADQQLVALIGLLFTGLLVFLRSKSRFSKTAKSGSFTAVIRYPSTVNQYEIIDILQKRSTYLDLKRVHISEDDYNEISFTIIFDSYKNIEQITNDLTNLNSKIYCDFVDTSRVLGA